MGGEWVSLYVQEGAMLSRLCINCHIPMLTRDGMCWCCYRCQAVTRWGEPQIVNLNAVPRRSGYPGGDGAIMTATDTTTDFERWLDEAGLSAGQKTLVVACIVWHDLGDYLVHADDPSLGALKRAMMEQSKLTPLPDGDVLFASTSVPPAFAPIRLSATWG